MLCCSLVVWGSKLHVSAVVGYSHEVAIRHTSKYQSASSKSMGDARFYRPRQILKCSRTSTRHTLAYDESRITQASPRNSQNSKSELLHEVMLMNSRNFSAETLK